jgi:methionyl-tRNA formyltransferase
MRETASIPKPEPRAQVLLFGLYELGLRALESMAARGLDLVGIVTKSEPIVEAQPFVRLARAMGHPVFTPESMRDAEFLRQIRRLAPDVIAVAGFHKMLPRELLRIPPRGVVNLHGSLLPQYRGPCPWKWAIMNGEKTLGASVHWMTEEVDRGDILAQQEVAIEPRDTAESLFHKICAVGGPLLARTVEDLEAGRVQPRVQDHRRASYYGVPSDEDCRIRWEWSAERICNRVRGLCPRPGAWTQYGGKRVRVRKAEPAEGPLGPVPGMILGRCADSLIVSTGRGNVSIGALSVEGEEAYSLWAIGLVPGTFFDPSPACEPHLKAT